MRLLYYLLTFFCGLVGVLSSLRSVERLFVGQGVMVVQLVFALGGLLLASTFLRKARAASAAKRQAAEGRRQ